VEFYCLECDELLMYAAAIGSDLPPSPWKRVVLEE